MFFKVGVVIEDRVNSPPVEGCRGATGWLFSRKDDDMRNTKSYFSLPYNPNLRDRAKELRKAGNLCEVLLWQQPHKKKFKGYDFDRQKIIGNYIVDFYCLDCNVVIEIDGSSHDYKGEHDVVRDMYLEGLGLVVIHIPAKDILRNLGGVMEMLYEHPALRHPLQRRNHPVAPRPPSTGGE